MCVPVAGYTKAACEAQRLSPLRPTVSPKRQTGVSEEGDLEGERDGEITGEKKGEETLVFEPVWV